MRYSMRSFCPFKSPLCPWFVRRVLILLVMGLSCWQQGSSAQPIEDPGPARWPAFLGIGASPIDPDSIPIEWSSHSNLAWKINTPGYGQSSPVIWGDRVYLTSVEGPMKETYHLLCIDLKGGTLLWDRSVGSDHPVKSTGYISRAAPTPVVDADSVIAFFESGNLVAWTHDGERIWERSLEKDYGPIQAEFGLGASPVQTRDSIFILVDHDRPGYLLKIDKRTGKTVWKADRPAKAAWSSPALVRLGGRTLVVTSSRGSIDVYDAMSGETVCDFCDVVGNTSNTPLPDAGGRFLIGASQGREAGKKITNLAMQLTLDSAGRWSLVKRWDAGRASSTFGSPIVYGGCAYWVGRKGILNCLDAESGKLNYKQRLGSSNWATPFGLGNRIYFFGKDGETTVIATGPQFKQLAVNRFDSATDQPAATETSEDSASASTGETRKDGANEPAVPADEPKPRMPQVTYGVAAVSGSLLIRTGDTLYCVRSLVSSNRQNDPED